MINHLRALKAATEPLWSTYLVQAPSTAPGEYLIWSSRSVGDGGELPICADTANIDTTVRLLARGRASESALIMLDRVHDTLAPGLLPAPLIVAGRVAAIRWVRSEFVDVDRDVPVTGTNQYPTYGVDTYHLISQPRS